MKMKKMFALLLLVVLFVSSVLAVPVSSLDKETKDSIKSYSPQIKEVEIIDWDYFNSKDGEIYDNTGDFVVVIIDGKVYIIPAK